MRMLQPNLMILVLVSLLAGAGAGITSSIFTSNVLNDYATALLGDRGFTALEPRKPGANPTDYQTAVGHIRDVQTRSLATFTRKSTDSDLVNKWLNLGDVLGTGTVVSANGWILTSVDELAGVTDPVTGLDVWIRGTRFAISEVKYDKLTPLVLVRLSDANGLSPVGFGASEDALDGDVVFVTPNVEEIVATSILNSEQIFLDGPQPAEAYSTSWSLVNGTNAHGPVFSATGDLLAFDLVGEDRAVPFQHAASFVQEVIRDGSLSYPVLGAYVVDVGSVLNLDAGVRQGLSTGALVYAPIGKMAVPIGTPANDAGVLARDVITAVDGEAISPTVSLSELLAIYDPGQTIKLSLVRGGVPIDLLIVLGTADSLLY